LKNNTSDLPWADLVAPAQTLVFYMGLIGLPIICAELIRHGRAADTPAALIQQGTTVNQRVFTGTLADLPRLVAEHEVHAPTLVIVGEVVQLRDKLKWFEGAQGTV
jgi:uroporphyrin-III C-methyltransferase/precorrin-2 dehydrogenase/sirohydrochlorin ferrochelatase